MRLSYPQLIVTALICAAGTGIAAAAPRYDFHGLLFKCGRYPTVNLDGKGDVWAYEADLTHYVQGTAKLGKDTVTMTFPRRFPAFTIMKRGKDFFAGKTRCEVDDV